MIRSMVEAALMILIVLFVTGYVTIPGVHIPNYQLYTYNHHIFTLNELLIFLVLFWIIGFVPRYLRIFVGALLIIWIVATLGIIAVTNLPAIVIGVLIFALLIHRSFHHYSRYRRRYYE